LRGSGRTSVCESPRRLRTEAQLQGPSAAAAVLPRSPLRLAGKYSNYSLARLWLILAGPMASAINNLSALAQKRAEAPQGIRVGLRSNHRGIGGDMPVASPRIAHDRLIKPATVRVQNRRYLRSASLGIGGLTSISGLLALIGVAASSSAIRLNRRSRTPAKFCSETTALTASFGTSNGKQAIAARILTGSSGGSGAVLGQVANVGTLVSRALSVSITVPKIAGARCPLERETTTRPFRSIF
jgi:hypothetical protein